MDKTLEISPLQAASLADDSYAVSKYPGLEEAFVFLNGKYHDSFTFNSSNLLKAKTGGPGMIKCRTAFGFTLIGRGRYEGHIFILFRGTQNLADKLTDANFSVSRSACGYPVHDGFNQTFMTMRPKLTDFMNSLRREKIIAIHCIGHSLGGGLATLCANWVAKTYGKKPYLYTFGSPRVGLYGFANACAKSVESKNIFRVYHRTDLVPFLPTWPYLHTPINGTDYYIYSPGLFPWVTYHGMDTYLNSVKNHTEWTTLGNSNPTSITDSGIMQWLKQETPLGLTISALEWLNHALVYVLNKCSHGAAWLISEGYTNNFTLMDKLAYILHKGINLAESISEWVVLLMRKIMNLLGLKKVVDGVDLTHAVIRTLLLNLQQKLNQNVRDTLNKVLVDGRAV